MSLPKFKVRSGQREFERGVEQHRISGLLARRQYGKTTIAARIALKKMMKVAGHTVIFGSVKLDLGREIVRKEADALQRVFALLAQQAAEAKTKLEAVETTGNKTVTEVSADDWADLYEHSRLEFRLFHSRSVYSRTKVVALTPDAVGETGDLILDEIGRAKHFGDVLEAVMPIIAANPDFRCIYTTTPPPDDTHVSFDLLAPPIDAELPVNPKGNWYRSDLGVWVLRITAEDAYADGVMLYDDDTGQPISPAESRARSNDKDAWDRNYGCHFVFGGTAACSLMLLNTAQQRGIGQCLFVQVDNDLSFDIALAFLRAHLTNGPVGIGVDIATTTKGTSNPTGVTVTEKIGVEKIQRLVITWKTWDPDIATERIERIVDCVYRRPDGGRARRLATDGTNERYYAISLSRALAGAIPVDIVVMSEGIEVPGNEKPINYKTHLSSRYVGELEDNHLTLPPERYIKDDHRLVKKDRGLFVCEPDAQGRHGDTFSSGMLADWAVESTSGAITREVMGQIRMGQNSTIRPAFVPRRLT